MRRGEGFEPTSRETFLLINNLLLTVMAATILLGTLYPLAVDALGDSRISVGPPYFSLLFGLLLVPLVLAVPLGMLVRWRGDRMARVLKAAGWPLALAIAAGAAVAWGVDGAGLRGAAGVAAAAWILLGCVQYLRGRQSGAARLNRSEGAMLLAHAGLAVFLVGAALVGAISDETHVRLAPGERVALAGYDFEFHGTEVVRGPNYVADRGRFTVHRDGVASGELLPEKRRYLQGGQVMTEAAIDPGFTRDLYVSLGEPLEATSGSGGGQAWAVRVYHKPFVRWIWLGALMMMAAGLLGASDRRLRAQRPAEEAA